jgi:hypothetical protein
MEELYAERAFLETALVQATEENDQIVIKRLLDKNLLEICNHACFVHV